MATRRPTFGKRERDRAKKARAAAKRERRQERKAGDEADEHEDAAGGPVDEGALLARLEDLHRRFDDGQIGFEDFEEQRDELIAQLTAGA